MKNLISMTDFVLEQGTEINTGEMFYRRVWSYANFLKQPLELGMFVPCLLTGGYNVVLEEPKCNVCGVSIGDYCGRSKECAQSNENEFLIYREAKERCLFKDCVCVYDYEMKIVRSHDGKDLFYVPEKSFFTIETLVKFELQLTETAIKQISV